ncbi:MAG: hypothetical protein HUU50_09690 [Candidatus Brocadiae bacterium]|nr:hypothetical protein [Candidatus Brocadiia bacterium]
MKWFYILVLSIAFLSACDSHSSSTSKEVKNEQFDLGQSVSSAVKSYIKTEENAKEKLEVYSSHEEKVVDSINYVADNNPEKSKSKERINQEILKALFALIRDNTIPQLTEALGKFLKQIEEDRDTLKAIADFSNTKTGTDLQNTVEMVHKLLSYEKSKELWKAFAVLMKKNPTLLKEILTLVHQALANLPKDESTVKFFQFLCQEVVQSSQDLGREAWTVRLDKNDNPKVLGRNDNLFAPFVDKDQDGVCDTNPEGQPIDADGKALEIFAFSKEQYKDSQGNILILRDEAKRAITPQGDFVFEYYNAKKSVLAHLLFSVSNILRLDLPEDALKFITVALKPMKGYVDKWGSYQGYSNESEAFKAMVGGLEIFKDQKIHHLILGFATMLNEQEWETLAPAFISLGEMFWKEWRDNPAIQDQASLQKWFEDFPNNPPAEIFPMLQLMCATHIKDLPYDNMAMLFFYWISSEYPNLAEKFWPLVQTLRKVKDAYPDDPQLTERIYRNFLLYLKWAIIHKVEYNHETKPVLSIVMEKFVQSISNDPDSFVKDAQEKITRLIPSRWFMLLIQCLENFIGYEIFKDAVIHYTTPQTEEDQDAYTEIVRVHIGMMECRQSIITKVHLFQLMGKFLDPDLAIMVNLLNSFTRLVLADKDLVFLQLGRNMFSSFDPYDQSPVSIFLRAYFDVSNAAVNPKPGKELKEEDIARMLQSFGTFLTDDNGLLQKLYNVIQKKIRS